jgi:predicted Zn-dependent peptidase
MSVPYEVVLPAIEETFGEITRIQTVPVSAAELERAKQDLTDRVYFKTENIQDLSRFVAIQAAYTQDQESPERTLVALRSVTAEEIQRVAHTYLDLQGAVVTVTGDRQAVSKFAPALVERQLPSWNLQRPAKEDE